MTTPADDCAAGRHCLIRIYDQALRAWFLQCINCQHTIPE